MPAGSGRSVYENLRNSQKTASLPVLFVSAIPETELSRMAQELGAAGYLCKPYDPAELIAKIKEIVGE
jgi:DNA-binding response OmpR family regulator